MVWRSACQTFFREAVPASGRGTSPSDWSPPASGSLSSGPARVARPLGSLNSSKGPCNIGAGSFEPLILGVVREGTGRPDATCVLAWPRPSDRMKRSHANTTDATEEGAYAVASLAVHALDGWRIIARAPTESGADIWMARPEDDPDGQVRLEVSGIAEGADTAAATALRARLHGKIAQLRRGKASEPGIAAGGRL